MSILKNHVRLRNIKVVLSPEDRVVDAINCMFQNNESFVILQKNQKIVGIFTQGDLKNRIVARKIDPAKTKLSDVMTSELSLFDINDSLDHCLSKIEKKKIHHLPILSNGKLVAVFSTIKLLQLAFKELAIEREELIHYITGESAAIS
jgi:signal-transduction protein with cAMP-binding, CBS, and nucleotidyltransferase domain